MNPAIWHKVAAVSGVAALGLGTYGAHAFKPKNPTYKEVWHTASLYHLVHTAALLAAPVTKHPNIFGGLLTTGILAFSGTCYAVAYLEDRTYSKVAPFGGFAFIGCFFENFNLLNVTCRKCNLLTMQLFRVYWENFSTIKFLTTNSLKNTTV